MTSEKYTMLWLTILRVIGVAILLAGVVLAIGGGRLVLLGGSPYYLLFGIAAAVSGVLLVLSRREGALLYGLAFLATLAWAIWEAGYDGWALMPRLIAPGVVGVPLLIPGVRRLLGGRPLPVSSRGAVAIVAALLVAGPLLRAVVPPPISPDPIYQTGTAAASAPHEIPASAAANDWLHFGNNLAGTRFSSLSQLTPANVAKLETAWSVHFGVMPSGMEATPVKVGNALYICTSLNDVVALDATSGKQLWRFEAHISEPELKALLRAHVVCRGVSYYRVPGGTGHCAERIVTNTEDARLISLDAQDGRPCEGFGTNGTVSLLTGMGDFPRAHYRLTAAPTIALGKIIVGGSVTDNGTKNEPSGVVRAFDAVTGKLRWAWDAGNPALTGEPPPGEFYTPGTPDAWAAMSADEQLGLVYVPTATPTPEFFGGYRQPFDEAYDTAVVALDLATGKPRWSFQAVHHDLWDHDAAGQPTLIDYTTPDGRPMRAVVQPTKTGELFVLDRATGKPLKKVVEKPVSQAGAVPEERLSPTQPYSVDMPSFAGARLHESDMWGISPFDQLWCRVRFRTARYDGPSTPPGLTPAIVYPGSAGGINWGGIAYDPSRGIVIVNSISLPHYMPPLTRKQNGSGPGGLPYDGATDGAMDWFLSPLGTPCGRPPYGRLSAVDLKTGKLIWTRALGTAQDSGPLGIRSRLPITLGVPNLGGAMVTQSGLTFIGATQDKYLRAFETSTGKLLWQARLPSTAQTTPVTYVSPEDGRQYVVIVAGGHLVFPEPMDVYVMAYALPKK